MKSFSFAVVLLLSLAVWLGSSAHATPFLRNGRLMKRLLHLKRTEGLDASQVPKPQWFTQTLDHFNSHDSHTWQQRYFVNDTFWDAHSGPVFLMISGEGTAEPEFLAVNTEFMLNAQKYKALAVMLEHRYYGASHPTPDASVDNLKYLSSRQALEDIVSFKKFVTSQFNLTDNDWVSFGGSYPGALSAWLRIKYPSVVVGAVATSGPVQAQVNFKEYLEVVTASLATSKQGEKCNCAIQNATTQLAIMLKDKSKWKDVEKLFHLDPPLKNNNDVALLSETLAGYFMETVQYNNIIDSANISVLCDIMTNASIGAPLQRYAAVNNYFLSLSGEETLDVNFSAEVEELKKDKWDEEDEEAMAERLWYYQTCTEFGYYQTTDSPDQPFGNLLTLDHYTQLCSLVYGIQPDAISKSVNTTNAHYGGRNISKSATNIVFPNGSIDPWHALGILHNISDSLVAIFIEGTAHCANMEPPRPEDPVSLVHAREKITEYVGKWLHKTKLQ